MPFKKGDKSINRNGRPKGSKGLNLTNILKEKLECFPDAKGNKRYKELIIEKILQKASKGEDTSIKLIMNYIDGLPRQSIDMKTDINLLFDDTFKEDETP